VNGIDVFKGDYETAEGIRVGSAESAVTAAYGRPEIVEVPLIGGSVRKARLQKGITVPTARNSVLN
jgi:hypothetical protein